MELSEKLKDFIKEEDWIFAKTYAETWPHEYIVQERVDNELFLKLAYHIDQFGYEDYQKIKGNKMQSLLGQFYNRIIGSQEDIASESLTYILKKSIRARQTINQIVNLYTGLEFSDLSYQTQNVGDKLERPDISGIDEMGQEVLLIEAKFWASLTSNQPNAYLKRLEDNSVLIFFVPTLRVRAVFDEVLRRIKEEFTDLEIDLENHKIKIIQSTKYILIKNWNEILNAIKSELIQENNQTLISDIDQIIGFCDTIDNNSFQPIIDSDLSPSIPRKIKSYYDIVDKVVDEIKNKRKDASTKGLNRTRHKFGYRRYFSINKFGFGIDLELSLWAGIADTPFWLSISIIDANQKNWIRTSKFKRKCEKIGNKLNLHFVDRGNDTLLSLNPKLNMTEDAVIKDLVDKIEHIYKELEE